MIDHDQVLQRILEEKVIVVLRGIERERVEEVTAALYRGGIRVLEFALPHGEGRDQDRSDQEETADLIRRCRSLYGQDLLVGAGTILSPQEADLAHQAGALYAISPVSDRSVIEKTRSLGMVSIPGAYTPTEIFQAYAWGGDIIKIFPAGHIGAGFFKDMRGPLGHIPLAAVAGITPDNALDFLRAGACCLGVSSYLASPLLSASEMEERARLFLEKIERA